MTKNNTIVAPFPWFGGKRKVAEKVWEEFGNVDNYVEPFGGSLAVLLARPDTHQWWLKKETAGDFSGHIVNFYRAVAAAPEKVAKHASYPVNETDLTARHLYLVRYENDLAEKLAADPKYFDAEAAGWWVWGISAWVGGDWMTGIGPYKGGTEGIGVYRKMPMVAGSHGGKGIHKPIKTIPYEEGVTPDLVTAYENNLFETFKIISNRLHRVRLTCGDWKRLTGAAIDAGANKVTGIFLDPPYDLKMRRGDLYRSDNVQDKEHQIHDEAREWALSKTEDFSKKIAYCSYDNEEEEQLFLKAGWTPYRWSASGGYSLQANTSARENKDKEIIWFSPSCQKIS